MVYMIWIGKRGTNDRPQPAGLTVNCPEGSKGDGTIARFRLVGTDLTLAPVLIVAPDWCLVVGIITPHISR